MKTRMLILSAGCVLGTLLAMGVPDAFMYHHEAQILADAPVVRHITRGIEMAQDARVDEMDRRLSRMEQEQFSARTAEMEMKVDQAELKAKVNTIFDLMRISVAAALTYLAQVIGKALVWVTKRTGRDV